MNFPLVLADNLSRHEVYWALNKAGVETTALYYALVPEINEDLYPASYSMSRRIINLPIHKDVSMDDIDHMVDQFMQIVG